MQNEVKQARENGPAVCPNGHAMDDGLFSCPACGAYRPSANGPKIRARCCGLIWEHGAFSQREPCHDCPEAVWNG